MKIQLNNKSYGLNVSRAKALGVLREVKNATITLTEDEGAVLHELFLHIGGPRNGARAQTESVQNKIYEAFGRHTPKTNIDLTKEANLQEIYYVK